MSGLVGSRFTCRNIIERYKHQTPFGCCTTFRKQHAVVQAKCGKEGLSSERKVARLLAPNPNVPFVPVVLHRGAAHVLRQ